MKAMVMNILVVLVLILSLTLNVRAYGAATLEWTIKAYGDGKHNAFTDLIRWHDQYYLCFRHGASHLSMDGEIRVMRSADLKSWQPCGTLDTFGDDRDPHFVATDQALYVFFGTWDLAHARDHGVPERGRLRSHFESSGDGEHWSKIQGVYEPCWWLWRVRWHDGAFYSAAYYLTWPASPSGEARLLRSEDALNWTEVSTITKDRIPDEADINFRPDGSLELVMRTCDAAGDAMVLRSDPARQQWTRKDLGVLIHCPVMATWKDRLFVAGRGRDGEKYVARIWELAGDQVHERITLPSDGDTAYPGLLVDPDTVNAQAPALFVSWYSQHERKSDAPDEASIYVGRVSITP